MAEVRGRVDALERRVDFLARTQANATAELTELTSSNADIALPKNATQPDQLQADPSNATNGTPAEAEAPQTFDSPQAMYDEALAQFRERNYQNAQALWARFIDENPKSDLVPNAYFWQGESYYQSQNYARAVLAYQEVIERFQDSSKYRPALLKQGLSFYKLGKTKPGRLLLQRVIDSAPDSPEAGRAETFLEQRSN